MSMWRRRSLVFRFIAGAVIAILVGFGAGSVLLSFVFERSISQMIDNYVIRDTLDALLVATEEERPGVLRIDESFRDPRFTLSGSQLFWQIAQVGPRRPTGGADGAPAYDYRVLLWSRSLGEPDKQPTAFLPIRIAASDDKLLQDYLFYDDDIVTVAQLGLRIGSRVIEFETDGRKGGRYVFVVAVGKDRIAPTREEFDWALRISLGVLGVLLLVGTVVVVHIGLRPLRRIPPALAAIRTGKSDRITGAFPTEIEPLAHEINALLDQNTQVVERARTHVGNLAHALKTPLAVLTNEAAQSRSKLADKVTEQALVMTQQVEHHLSRARTAAQTGVLGARTSVMPVVEGLARTLEAINRDKGIRVAVDGPADAAFRGERQDLEEVLGNLMDNACKWARRRVRVTVSESDDGGRLTIRVEDDGPGLDPSQRRTALKRGMRIDEKAPGSGLGLSIVQDVVGLYEGSFDLAESQWGGLAAVIELPAAPED